MTWAKPAARRLPKDELDMLSTEDLLAMIKDAQEVVAARPPKPHKNYCNRHDDCDAAKKAAEAAGRNPYIICCTDEGCEECFGS